MCHVTAALSSIHWWLSAGAALTLWQPCTSYVLRRMCTILPMFVLYELVVPSELNPCSLKGC